MDAGELLTREIFSKKIANNVGKMFGGSRVSVTGLPILTEHLLRFSETVHLLGGEDRSVVLVDLNISSQTQ